jgi:AcrR family transcriptional regulator
MEQERNVRATLDLAMANAPSRAERPRESWAGDPPLRGAARHRLIEAAGRCVVRDGLAATTLSSVASEAGVSRPTVYRYFEDVQALILATLLEAGRALGGDLSRHLRAWREPRRMAIEAMLFVLSEVPRSPLLSAIWSSTALEAEMLADFTRPTVMAVAREALDRLVAAAGWSDTEAEECIEWMLRVLLSLLVAPGPERSEEELRELLERRLAPALAPVPDRRGGRR